MRVDKQVEQALAIGRQQAKTVIQLREKARRRREQAAKKRGLLAKSSGVLVAEGDSWFDYPLNDVLKELEDLHGFEVASVAHRGDPAEGMAYGPSQLDDFTRRIEKVLAHSQIKAILLSGGGNDIAGTAFEMLLNHSHSPIRGLNASIIDGVINERLRLAFVTIISAVTSICKEKIGEAIPIIVHGYDHPVPDGRGFLGGAGALPGPWLEPGFRAKGYEKLQERIALTASLIDDFNTMLEDVASLQPFKHVHYLDLRGTLSSGKNYKKFWANELHPTKRGFTDVAAKFASLIAKL